MGIPAPIRVRGVPKFEKKNQISVNVSGYEKQEIYPIHLTKKRGLCHVNLLILSSGEPSHYCWKKTSIDCSRTRITTKVSTTSASTFYMVLLKRSYWNCICHTGKYMGLSAQTYLLKMTSGYVILMSLNNLRCHLSCTRILNVFWKDNMAANQTRNTHQLYGSPSIHPAGLHTRSLG